MSDTPPVPAAAATQMHRQLAEHGITVLAVIADPVEAGWFTVYVQGPVGTYEQDTLFAFLTALPGVLDVVVSDLTPSILRVYREPGAPA
jgi:hypothetical protein